MAGTQWQRRARRRPRWLPTGFASASTPRFNGLQLCALPVVGPQGGATGADQPARLVLDDRPDNVLDTKPWPSTIVDDSHFRATKRPSATKPPSATTATWGFRGLGPRSRYDE